MTNYVEISLRQDTFESISDFMNRMRIHGINVQDFLNVENPRTKVKNRDSIFNAYSARTKKQANINSSSDVNETSLVYSPTIFAVPSNCITYYEDKVDTEFVQYRDQKAFVFEELLKIVNTSSVLINERVIKSNSNVQVLLWTKCTELSVVGADDEINGTIINLSPFIETLTTNVSDTGGNFSFTLPLLPGREFVATSQGNKAQSFNFWGIDKRYVTRTNAGWVVDNFFHKKKTFISDLPNERSDSFLMNAVYTNDIVFIKFDASSEGKEPLTGLYVDKSYLPDNNFDMICLVDSIYQLDSAQKRNITIEGRDLMKLILDDGTFFFDNSFSDKDSSGVFLNASTSGDANNTFNKAGSRANSRLPVNGVIQPFLLPSARTIGGVIDIVIKSLSNIQVAPDSLFEPYGDKRTTFKK